MVDGGRLVAFLGGWLSKLMFFLGIYRLVRYWRGRAFYEAQLRGSGKLMNDRLFCIHSLPGQWGQVDMK